MDEFMTADEEVKWDKYNGCVYKMYIMYEMSEQEWYKCLN